MKTTILIIEDNQELLENTAELLSLADYNVITALNGKRGLELIKAHHPDLILCDITMPELDGYGVLLAISNIEELTGIPFIFLTAKSDKECIRKGMNLGADDYLIKPFEGEELLAVIESRLKKARSLQKKFDHSLHELHSIMDEINSPEDLFDMSTIKTIKKLQVKDTLYQEGDSANFLYNIVSGKIKVYMTNELGKELIVHIYHKGDFLGHQALLDGLVHKNTAVALENTEVAMIPKQDFFNLLYSKREVALRFIRIISNNMDEAEEKLLKMAYNSARKRVAEALLLIYEKYKQDNNGSNCFPGARENISALAGISPESVSRNLTSFREEGLIETINGEIRILKPEKLLNMKN